MSQREKHPNRGTAQGPRLTARPPCENTLIIRMIIHHYSALVATLTFSALLAACVEEDAPNDIRGCPRLRAGCDGERHQQ